MVRVGVNGFGRIGRSYFRMVTGRPDIEIVAVNDLSTVETRHHLLRFDSIRGRLPAETRLDNDRLLIGDSSIKMVREREPADIPWGDLGVDIVLESTGRLADRGREHLRGGARRVIISGPGATADATLVMGLNEDTYDRERHFVVSNASCTVNCFGMMISVLADEFALESALITNVHSVSRQQGTQDADHNDLRMARAAGYNIVPQRPGAAAVLTRLMPRFDGLIKDYTLRVPVPIGSLNSVTALLDRPVTVAEVNSAMRRAAETGRLAPYLAYTEDPIVSTDIISSGASCVFDAGLTEVAGRQVQVVGWHDNEWGFASRLVDLTAYVGGLDGAAVGPSGPEGVLQESLS